MARDRHAERHSLARESRLEHQGWQAAQGREQRVRHPSRPWIDAELQRCLVRRRIDDGIKLVVLEHPLKEACHLLVGLAIDCQYIPKQIYVSS